MIKLYAWTNDLADVPQYSTKMGVGCWLELWFTAHLAVCVLNMAVVEASLCLDWVGGDYRVQDKCTFKGPGDELCNKQELDHDAPALELRVPQPLPTSSFDSQCGVVVEVEVCK